MRKIAILMISVLLAIQMLSAIPVEAQTLTATDINLSNIYNGVDITWVTNEKTTGWVQYSLDTPPSAANFMFANDTRDNGVASADERVESYTHSCRIDVDFTDGGKTVYMDIYGGTDVKLNTQGNLQVVPVVDPLTNTWIMTGSLSNTITGIPDALVFINITQGSAVSTQMSFLSINSGEIYFNTGNGIFFNGNETYVPAAGDRINLRVNAGPIGTATDSHLVTAEEASANSITLDIIEIPVPFTLSPVTVTPITGDTDTDFTFSVTYNATDAVGPDSVMISIDGTEHAMTGGSTNFSNAVAYTYTTSFSTGGNHSYYVVVDRAGIEVSTGATATGPNTLAVDGPADAVDDDGDDNTMLMVAGIAVVLVLVVLLVLMKKKKT